jgi:beta-glucosidase-like glycosyl hydrolase
MSARLLLPAVRADPVLGFSAVGPEIARAIEAGVGGFILFGGEAASVSHLIDEIRARAPHPLLIGADLERGAGQQFLGATALPPAAAIAFLDDPRLTRRAATLTAREARAIGVDWIFAPVADLDLERRNPILGTRSFGGEPARVAEHVAAWVEGAQAEGVLACAKHFPGHGRTTADSHLETPVVRAGRAELTADLLPFRGAVSAGVASIMTAHVRYRSLDREGAPATLSRRIIGGLLRRELGFSGLVVTDALDMAGVSGGRSEPAAAVAALQAGCDVLLHPSAVAPVVAGIQRALDAGELDDARVAEAVARVTAAAERVRPGRGGHWGAFADQGWALDLAIRTVVPVRGRPRVDSDSVDLLVVDDDSGGPHPTTAREALARALEEGGARLGPPGRRVVALFAETRAWKGRAGVSEEARRRIAALCGADSETILLLFGHPRLAEELPQALHLLCAWGGEPLMQRAAARALLDAVG